MFRTFGGFVLGTILTMLLGCAAVQPIVLGQGGSIERRSQGQVTREIYSGSGYSLETVKGDTRYRMIQAPGLGRIIATRPSSSRRRSAVWPRRSA